MPLKPLTLAFIFLPFYLPAQTIEIGPTIGMMAYQGDLAPSAVRGTIEQSHPMGGMYVHLALSPSIALNANIIYGHISGDDKHQLSEDRRLRNLQFKTYLFEYSLRIYTYPFAFRIGSRELRLFGGGGVARFHYNPKTLYQGAWIELWPLNTEGQGLFDNRPEYRLQGLALPVFGGVKISINEYWSLSAELVSHITFTDYLDDVSTTYPDFNTLLAQRGPLAVTLSDRSGELATGQLRPLGSMRGNAREDDWFVTLELKLAYRLSATKRHKVKCPEPN